MWSLITDTGTIKALYKDEEPSFEDLALVGIQIRIDVSINVLLTIESRELPKMLPEKWKIRRVNRIRHTFNCFDVAFLPFNLTKFGYQKR